ncbi:MAG: nicotinate (nicotinamide) nucleotide adenylyltransferase [Bacteroidetes bacterium]|nr:MAG: nicotinate (nicotinamide) nucleotide adenylyltransferase [Bacteroidota bacterium]
MQNYKRIGIFGGTFNPIDKAHISIVHSFIDEIKIDLCYIIPANISPFKTKDKDISVASNEHRINMLNLTFGNQSNCIIDSFEIDKGGISFSFETIQYIKFKHPDSDRFLLIGSDQAESFRKWKNWEWILRNVKLCIAMREGFSTKNEILENLKFEDKIPIILNSPLIKLSATEIRQKLKNNEPIKDFVSPDVDEYIRRNKLYNV